MDLKSMLAPSWRTVLGGELEEPYVAELGSFLEAEYAAGQVFPPEENIFAALNSSSFDQIKVLLLGQDPYHDDGQAHGLSFSVQPGVKTPPSLRNIYKELEADMGCRIPNNGCLTPWAEQGVLLLNAVLTVRAHQPASHRGRGWERFTDAVIEAVSGGANPVVFVLWGGFAKKKAKLIDAGRHVILQGAHPSPLSAHNGFFGTRPFSAINAALADFGKPPIDWQIPDV